MSNDLNVYDVYADTLGDPYIYDELSPEVWRTFASSVEPNTEQCPALGMSFSDGCGCTALGTLDFQLVDILPESLLTLIWEGCHELNTAEEYYEVTSCILAYVGLPSYEAQEDFLAIKRLTKA